MADIPPPPPGFTEPVGPAGIPPPPPGFTVPVNVPPVAATGGAPGAPSTEPAPGYTAAGEPPKPSSLVDTIMNGASTIGRIVDQGAQGFAEGVGNLLGLPGDLGKAIPGPVRMPEGSPVQFFGPLPFPTSDALKSIPRGLHEWSSNLFGFDPNANQPQTGWERGAKRVGEEVGAAAVPAGAAAQAGARIGVPAARAAIPASVAREGAGVPERAVRWFVDVVRQAPGKMVESAAVNPAKFVGKEAGGATAAGGGAAVVNYTTGKDIADATGQAPTALQQAGDIGGAFGGYGTAALGTKLWNLGKTIAGAFTGNTKQATNVANDITTDVIARAAGLEPNARGVIDTAPLADQIEQGATKFGAIPGLKPDIADATGNEGLAALTYSQQSGPNAGKYVIRRGENIKATDDAMNANAPNGQPGTFKSALEIERDARVDEASRIASDAAAEAEARSVGLRPDPTTTRDGRGNAIRAEVDTAAAAARQATADAYAAADVNGLPLRPTYLAEALDNVTNGLARAERSYAPRADIEAVANIPAGEAVTLREATSLRTKLIEQQQAALADPARRSEARVLGQYIDAVEEVIGQSVSAEQRAALEAARTQRRAQADAFELKGDPVAQIAARYKGGVPVRDPEAVANMAVDDGVIARLLQEADTPATRAAIRNELLSRLNTGSADSIAAFREKFAPQIARFPGLDDQLGTAINARLRETAARADESSILRELGATDGSVKGRSTVATYLKYGDENAEKAMRAVLASKDPAKAADELLTFVNDNPAAVEGARKVFWDILQKDTRSAGSTTGRVADNLQPYLPARLKAFLDDPVNAAVAARLWRDNPEHLDNIKKIAETLQQTDVRLRAKAPNSSGTAQGNQSVLPTAETMASRIFAVERGQVSPTFAALNIFGIMARKAIARQQQGLIGKITDRAILDPPFAVQLLRENNPANREALARGAKGWLGNEASSMVELLGQGDETKSAIMRGK